MKTFIYVYKTADNKIVKKKLKASNLESANNFLKKKNITPISIKQERLKLIEQLTKPTTVENDDIVAFSQLFAGCIQSGLNIKESLDLLSKQLKNALLTEKLSEIIIDIEGGAAISDSFSKHTDIFPKFYPMLLKAGEASGNLAEVLEYIANYLDKTNNLKKQIKSVLTYPAIVSVIGLGLLVVILIFVAPTFKDVFKSSGKDLPGPTKLLFYMSDLVINNYNLILLIILSVLLTFYLIHKNPKGKRALDTLSLYLPISGDITKQILLLRFLGAFDILINNNVPITQALAVIEEATSNMRLKEIITEMRKDVARGLPISGALINNPKIVSPMVSYTISMGEKAGNLGVSLNRISSFIDKELTYSMKKLTSKLDPIITFFLGMIVLFIAMAIYLPIFDLMLQ
ncbi:hypothetical protein DID78_01065 [Candidatus Marinamargulisbacteria bacterium SCGC AG-343-D04]|nr:hypothetical protein DID78_01065 [Candidatus Marinamargulisbacteria bacterium SCGC AG-343-D04]